MSPQDRLSLQQYGFDPDRSIAGPDDRKDGPLTGIFVGRCEPRKGLHLALEAWIASGVADQGTFLICGSFVAWLSRVSRSRCSLIRASKCLGSSPILAS